MITDLAESPPTLVDHRPPSTQPFVRLIPITQIDTDGGTQTRVKVRDDVVEEYAQDMSENDARSFPPIVVFTEDNDKFLLADGFHRVYAAFRLARSEILAEVRRGGRLDAFLYSLGANTTHGLRRTNADKRHSVTLAFNEETLRDSTDHVIADLCGVSNHLVGGVRRKWQSMNDAQLGNSPNSRPETKRKGRDGKRYPSHRKTRGVSKQETVDASDAPANRLHVIPPTGNSAVVDGDGGINGNAPTRQAASLTTHEKSEKPGAFTQPDVKAASEPVSPDNQLPEVTHPAKHPVAGVTWAGGLVTEEQLRGRLECVHTAHPSDRYNEAQRDAFQQYLTALVHTVNRLTGDVPLPRSVQKKVAADTATALGKFIATLPSPAD